MLNLFFSMCKTRHEIWDIHSGPKALRKQKNVCARFHRKIPTVYMCYISVCHNGYTIRSDVVRLLSSLLVICTGNMTLLIRQDSIRVSKLTNNCSLKKRKKNEPAKGQGRRQHVKGVHAIWSQLNYTGPGVTLPVQFRWDEMRWVMWTLL